jgi:hypothetical protein
MCEQVASQSAKLEKQIQRASRKDKSSTLKTPESRNTNDDSPGSSDSDEFHDAESVFRIPLQHKDKQSKNIVDDNFSSGDDEDDDESESEEQEKKLPVVVVTSILN